MGEAPAGSSLGPEGAGSGGCRGGTKGGRKRKAEEMGQCRIPQSDRQLRKRKQGGASDVVPQSTSGHWAIVHRFQLFPITSFVSNG